MEYNDIIDKNALEANVNAYDTAKVEPIREDVADLQTNTPRIQRKTMTIEAGTVGWITLAKSKSDKDSIGLPPTRITVSSMTLGNSRATFSTELSADLRNCRMAVLDNNRWAYQFTNLKMFYDGSNPYDYYVGVYIGRNNSGAKLEVELETLAPAVEWDESNKTTELELVCEISTPPGTAGADVNLESFPGLPFVSSSGFGDGGQGTSSLYNLTVRNLLNQPCRVQYAQFTATAGWRDMIYIPYYDSGAAIFEVSISDSTGESCSMVLALTKSYGTSPTVTVLSFTGNASEDAKRSVTKIKICTVENPTASNSYIVKMYLQGSKYVRMSIIQTTRTSGTVSSTSINLAGGFNLYTNSSGVSAPVTIASKELDYDTYYNKAGSITVLGY